VDSGGNGGIKPHDGAIGWRDYEAPAFLTISSSSTPKGKGMTDKKEIMLELKIAELQFRLAVAVRIACTLKNQPLDAPTEWTHGKHRVLYEEIALSQDQADVAAGFLEQTATYLMAITIKEALEKSFLDPKKHSDKNIVAAYRISKLIRNAFAHSPIRPVWKIGPAYKDKEFIVDGVITLNTKGLDRKTFDWQDYGGLLALFRLSKFVRIQELRDTDTGRKRSIPLPKNIIYKQGDLILKKIDKIPKNAKSLSRKLCN